MNLYENNKRNSMIKRLSSFLLALTMANSASACVSNISVEKEVKISKSSRNSLYTYDMHSLGANNYSYDDDEDIFITDKTLRNLEKVNIDGQRYDDLRYLEYCKNIEYLVINNIELIKPEDMKYILKVSNINKLIITLSASNLSKNPNFKIDLNKFSNVKKLKIFNGFCPNPMEDDNLVDTIICYSAICDINDNIDVTKVDFLGLNHEEIETIKSIYSKGKKVVEDIKNIPNEKEKILRLISYISNNFEYDEKVEEEVENGEFFNNEESISIKLAEDYNKNILDSFMKDEEASAVCANYAATFTFLCYLSGIECYTIDGFYIRIPHAWNYINSEGKYYIVDPTSLDELFEDTNDLYIHNSVDAYALRAFKDPDDIWNSLYKPNKYYKNIVGKSIDDLSVKNTEYCNIDQKRIVKIKNQKELELATILLLISIMLTRYFKSYKGNSMQFKYKKK